MEIGKKEISVRKAWELHPSQSVRPAAMGGERWAVCSAAAELQAGGDVLLSLPSAGALEGQWPRSVPKA